MQCSYARADKKLHLRCRGLTGLLQGHEVRIYKLLQQLREVTDDRDAHRGQVGEEKKGIRELVQVSSREGHNE